MTLTRILTAAGCAALLGGTAAMAQSVNDQRPKDVYGNTPAADDTLSVTTDVEIATPATAAGMPASTITADGAPGTITTTLVTNGPVPDTAENRRRFGGPMSRAGKMTTPVGN